MARLYLLIDGYNLMHADGLGSVRKGKLQSGRNRAEFLRRLQKKLNPELHADTIVVFDGVDDAAQLSLSANSAITIRFAGHQSDADTEIERLLAGHSSPRQVLIVSSDHRLHKAATRRKATAVDSDAFWDLIEDFDPDDSSLSHRQFHPPTMNGDRLKPIDAEAIELPEDFFDFDSR